MPLNIKPSSRFEIDPRSYPKDKVYLYGIALWGVFVLGFTYIGIRHQLWVIASFGGFLFLIIPYIVAQRNRGDILEVTDKELIISRSNPQKQQFKIPRKHPLKITIEHVESFDDLESTATLNLWDNYCGFERRTILGFWLSQESKTKVSKDLIDFLNRHEFRINYHNKTEKMPSIKLEVQH